MTDSYEIEKPTSDLNYLTIGIKYIVLFIVIFLASWIAIPLLVSTGRPTRVNIVAKFLFENTFLFSVLISVVILSWFIYRTIKKYKLGEVFKIEFNDFDHKLNIKTTNLANNHEKDNSYEYKNIVYKLCNSKDALFGKQRVLQILNNNKTVHEINFDRTAWCRNERIDKLIEKVEKLGTTPYKANGEVGY